MVQGTGGAAACSLHCAGLYGLSGQCQHRCASTICLEAMEQIREEIISPNPKLSSALEEFYTITRIHPGTSYAYLAQDLRVLSNPALVSKLTEHQREYISDALNVFCDNERYAEQEDYLYGVHAIINQVAPNPTGM